MRAVELLVRGAAVANVSFEFVIIEQKTPDALFFGKRRKPVHGLPLERERLKLDDVDSRVLLPYKKFQAKVRLRFAFQDFFQRGRNRNDALRTRFREALFRVRQTGSNCKKRQGNAGRSADSMV